MSNKSYLVEPLLLAEIRRVLKLKEPMPAYVLNALKRIVEETDQSNADASRR